MAEDRGFVIKENGIAKPGSMMFMQVMAISRFLIS